MLVRIPFPEACFAGLLDVFSNHRRPHGHVQNPPLPFHNHPSPYPCRSHNPLDILENPAHGVPESSRCRCPRPYPCQDHPLRMRRTRYHVPQSELSLRLPQRTPRSDPEWVGTMGSSESREVLVARSGETSGVGIPSWSPIFRSAFRPENSSE